MNIIVPLNYSLNFPQTKHFKLLQISQFESKLQHEANTNNELIVSNENALNTISLFRVALLVLPHLSSCVTYQLWMKSPLIKTCKNSLPLQPLFIYQVHSDTEKKSSNSSEMESAEGWKIAYQIEAIRLNCSHKYCFSHAYVSPMIASAFRNGPCCNVCRIAMWFFLNFSPFVAIAYARFCLRCSFSTEQKRRKNFTTCGVPSKSAFLK